MVYRHFDETINNEIISKKELTEELTQTNYYKT